MTLPQTRYAVDQRAREIIINKNIWYQTNTHTRREKKCTPTTRASFFCSARTSSLSLSLTSAHQSSLDGRTIIIMVCARMMISRRERWTQKMFLRYLGFFSARGIIDSVVRGCEIAKRFPKIGLICARERKKFKGRYSNPSITVSNLSPLHRKFQLKILQPKAAGATELAAGCCVR
jgi:hypothetical protein